MRLEWKSALLGVAVGILMVVAFLFATSVMSSKRRPPTHPLGIAKYEGKAIARLVDVTSSPQWVERAMQVRASNYGTLAQPPEGWPAESVWIPQRHFGPFYHGSELPEIQLLVEGSGATWFFNQFLSAHPKATTYKNYMGNLFPGNATPSRPSPTYSDVPGTYPSNDGVGDALLTLQRIRYSSRYGGSVELLFELAEDYEYDVRSADLLWDLESMELRVYVVPRAMQFNSVMTFPEQLYVETLAKPRTAYRIMNQVISALDDPHVTELKAQLASTSASIATGYQFRRTAISFVYGFVHSLFTDVIGPQDKVQMLVLAEDFINFTTTPGEAVFVVHFQLTSVIDELAPGNHLVETMVGASTFLEGEGSPRQTGPVYYEVINGGGTPMNVYGVFSVQDECRKLSGIVFRIDVHEVGHTDPSDRVASAFVFAPERAEFCAALEQRASQGTYGPFTTAQFDGVLQQGVIGGAGDTFGAFFGRVYVNMVLR